MLVVINIDSLMRVTVCGKLHRPPSQLFALQQSSRIAIFAYLMHSTPWFKGSGDI